MKQILRLVALLLLRPAVAVEPSAQDFEMARLWSGQHLATHDVAQLPFSFTYGGKPSSALLNDWPVERSEQTIDATTVKQTMIFRERSDGLEVRFIATIYRDLPAVEWVVRFHNSGSADTQIIEDIQAADVAFSAPGEEPCKLLHSAGTGAKAIEYQPLRDSLAKGAPLRFVPYGGRPSDHTLPFFNLIAPSGSGVMVALGWTGQWAAEFQRSPGEMHLRAGFEVAHLKLLPGEEIRSPSVLLVFWAGDDAQRGNNLLRRTIRERYSPMVAGKLVEPPVSLPPLIQFEKYSADFLLRSIEAMAAHRYPADTVWVDAGWYKCPDKPNGWAETVGNLIAADPIRFPNGMKPVGDAALQHGYNFLVWFEPERVMPGTWLYEQHPEWLLTPSDLPPERAYQKDWRLFDFGNPAALTWAKNQYATFLKDNAITVYRQDCNAHPVFYWRNAEPFDRRGMREIKHVMGLYDFLDSLMARVPGLRLDVCSGTGSRVDLEMVRRAFNLTRSDDAWWEAIADQARTHAYSLWLPHTGIGSISPGPYEFRSGIGSHVNTCFDPTTASETDWQRWSEALALHRKLRPFFTGDFFPLTKWSVARDAWLAWQFHREDLHGGIVQAFRRPDSSVTTEKLRLHSLDPSADYEFTDLDTGNVRRIRGRDLATDGLSIEMPQHPSSSVFLYRQVL
jgi:alpha-galactosidase